MKTKSDIQIGLNTQNQLQAICPVSLRPMNKIVNNQKYILASRYSQ